SAGYPERGRHMKRSAAIFLISSLMLLARAPAQEHEHGQGSEKLGTVQFETSCNAPAQQEFNRGVALLHSFQFSRAIDGFQRTLKADPSCAMAYWGVALSQWSNPFADGLRLPS